MAEAGSRLDDAAVEERIARLDAVLGDLERMPGRTAELAMTAVETLTEVYGEALCRVVDGATATPLLDALAGDELLRHLMLLHGIHPHPVERRVARAVDDLRPRLRSQNAHAELLDVRDGVARISLSTGSCGCGTQDASPDALLDLVRQHVLTVAPELSAVDVHAPTPGLIPVAAVRHRSTAGRSA